ncbi:MAG: hypothetical protein IKH65_08155 [Clostridia bacterium]|nr:hypothetical protein [Clostridia bacterium]MBR6940763.1 hypothetical protein [Clostridia bacterium]
MSYIKTVSEEIRIHIVDDTTRFVAKSLGYYIDNFFTMYQISYLDIFNATLVVDGEKLELNHFRNEYGKAFHLASKGKNKGKMVPIGSKPSRYYALRSWARDLKNAKDVEFRIFYEAYRHLGADIGIECMIEALGGLNCASVRKNVVYKGMQEYDFTEEITAFRFDKNYQEYADWTDDASVISDSGMWEMNCNGSIYFPDIDTELSDNREMVEEIISKVKPLLDKYGLEIDEPDKVSTDSIEVYGYVFVTKDELDEFLTDFQTVIDILAPYEATVNGPSTHMVCRDYGRFAAINFNIDENHKLLKSYACL